MKYAPMITLSSLANFRSHTLGCVSSRVNNNMKELRKLCIEATPFFSPEKSVFSLEVNSAESKRWVMKGAASLRGIDSLSIDSNKKQLTVVGDVDPVKVVQKLKKKFNAKIETVGQNKNEVKDGEIEKKDIEWFMGSLLDANYHNYWACYDYGCPRCCHPVEDRPSGCVIS